MSKTKWVKAQLHLHTNLDKSDSFINYSPKQAINKAVEENFKFLSITHHCEYFFSEELQKYAFEKGLILIKGIELRIDGQDVLAYNVDKKIEKIKTFEDLRNYKKENPQIVLVAPHPFYPGHCLRKNLFKYQDLFDGVEYCWFYTLFLNFYNKKAVRFSQKYNKFLLGTADVHFLEFFTTTFSWVKVDINFDEIVYKNIDQYVAIFWQNLRNKNIKIESKPLIFFRFMGFCLGMIFLWIKRNFKIFFNKKNFIFNFLLLK